jgi:hypothetical protein
MSLVEIMAAEPGAVIEAVVREHGVTARQVVEALPAAMRRFGSGEHLPELMNSISGWGDVTLIVNSEDGIFEFTGPIAAGQVSRGYYNVMARTGFHGHLRHEQCSEIAFVERPFMGRPSAFAAFFNRDDGIMFKVFLGRDAEGNLQSSQLESFRKSADKVCSANK